MASNRVRRVNKEIADIANDTVSHISVTPAGNGEDIMHLKGSFNGPPGTPYEGGEYIIDVKIPGEYPFRPPVMKFDTRVWHPNISSQTGAICLDTLSSAWSPVLTIKSALLSLQSLLSTPEPKDPQDAEVASMLIRNPKEFDRIAQEWAVKYAKAPKRDTGESSSGETKSVSQSRAPKKSREEEEAERLAQYGGYNQQTIDEFVNMGFDLDRVVAAFQFVGLPTSRGQRYELEPAYIGDITARLLGEP